MMIISTCLKKNKNKKTITDPNEFNKEINKKEKTITDVIAFNEQINKKRNRHNYRTI